MGLMLSAATYNSWFKPQLLPNKHVSAMTSSYRICVCSHIEVVLAGVLGLGVLADFIWQVANALPICNILPKFATALASYRIGKPRNPENRNTNSQKIGKIGENWRKIGKKIGNSYFLPFFVPIF